MAENNLVVVACARQDLVREDKFYWEFFLKAWLHGHNEPIIALILYF